MLPQSMALWHIEYLKSICENKEARKLPWPLHLALVSWKQEISPPCKRYFPYTRNKGDILSPGVRNLGPRRQYKQTMLILYYFLPIAETTLYCQIFTYLLFPSWKGIKTCCSGYFFESSILPCTCKKSVTFVCFLPINSMSFYLLGPVRTPNMVGENLSSSTVLQGTHSKGVSLSTAFLLRYIWHATLHKFKVYCIITSYTYNKMFAKISLVSIYFLI